jgi:hypothetical protein
VILAGLAALVLAAFGGADDDQSRPDTPVPRQQFVIRVTGVIRGPSAGGPPIEWREHRGPRCIPAARILGAALARQDSVDLIFRDRTRMRARLERRCAALDFYRSMYVSMTPDGLICADRDSIRSRTGGECMIDQFRSLTARASR